MFTGLVLETGRVTAGVEPSGKGGDRLRLSCSDELQSRLEVGGSLAVSGVCLTVLERHRAEVTVELSPETAARTTLARLREGDHVNLEPALRVGDALGGHWVQGHVDGTVRVMDRTDHRDHRVLRFELPEQHGRYVVEKGSLAVDGVSLTVSHLLEGAFEVALIPHTLEQTTLGEADVGTEANLELDVLAKYVERIVASLWSREPA